MDTNEMIKESFQRVGLLQRARKFLFGTPLTKSIPLIGTVTAEGRMATRLLKEFSYRHPRALAQAQAGNINALQRDFEKFKNLFFKEMGLSGDARNLVETKLKSFAGNPKVLRAQVLRHTMKIQRGLEAAPTTPKLPDIKGAIKKLVLPGAAVGATGAAASAGGEPAPPPSIGLPQWTQERYGY